MNKGLLIILFLFSCFLSVAQNLVQNFSFEDTSDCPYQINQVNFAVGWNTYGGTPDYFHICANGVSPMFSVPANTKGFQQPHSGNAYAGLFTFSTFVADQREYIGRQLLQPLIIGQQYFISFWVCHADTSFLLKATNNIGVKFSTVPFSLINPDTPQNNAHVFQPTIISDTANWVLVQGSFIADSAYSFISIGNYFTDAQTAVIQIGSISSAYAYYFIDDVCVSPDSAACIFEPSSYGHLNQYEGITIQNPISNSFVVGIQIPGFFHLNVYNAFAELIFQGKISNQESVNCSDWKDGIYFYEIYQFGKKPITGKVLKRNE